MTLLELKEVSLVLRSLITILSIRAQGWRRASDTALCIHTSRHLAQLRCDLLEGFISLATCLLRLGAFPMIAVIGKLSGLPAGFPDRQAIEMCQLWMTKLHSTDATY